MNFLHIFSTHNKNKNKYIQPILKRMVPTPFNELSSIKLKKNALITLISLIVLNKK